MTNNTWVCIPDMDITFDNTTETFESMLETLSREVPSAFVRVRRMVGSGGGWPEGSTIVKVGELSNLFDFFGISEGDVDVIPIEDF